MSKHNIYTVGGTVQAGNGLYIPRKADEQLLTFCQAGDFAFVLTPRQLGKSSLVVSTAERLAEENVRSVIIDLSLMGTKLSSEAWYLGLLDKIQETLALKPDVFKWWTEHAHLGVTQRLIEFLEKIVLVEIEDRVVIFVDEIDTTLGLDFTDDFFAAIRYLYNARSISPRFKRLSFVLIGVAAPGDLIRDERRTPFNIGKRVDLTDFTKEEALPLADGMGLPDKQAQVALARIMDWTRGHPYLTQRLCKAITAKPQAEWKEADVDKVVISTFFSADSAHDNNLQFVRDMLTKRAPDKSEVLNMYRAIRSGWKQVLDEEQSIIKNHLKLSGVVCRESSPSKLRRRSLGSGQAVLRPRNRIYRKAFNRAWVNQHMPPSWFARARKSGLLIIAILLAISVGVLTISWLRAVQRQRLAEENAFSLMQADFKSRDYLEYQNHSSNYEQPLLSHTIYDEPARGKLSLVVYADDSVRVSRKGPEANPIVINTWIPKLPKNVEGPPSAPPSGAPPPVQSQLTPEPTRYPFQLASLAPADAALAVVAGNCLDPHPGQFRSWYGEKNGCWVAVYRQWPDGCTHYQWYNACYNYWDTHPNGAPKVYWTQCVH
jgi:hypothetical protein